MNIANTTNLRTPHPQENSKFPSTVEPTVTNPPKHCSRKSSSKAPPSLHQQRVAAHSVVVVDSVHLLDLGLPARRDNQAPRTLGVNRRAAGGAPAIQQPRARSSSSSTASRDTQRFACERARRPLGSSGPGAFRRCSLRASFLRAEGGRAALSQGRRGLLGIKGLREGRIEI